MGSCESSAVLHGQYLFGRGEAVLAGKVPDVPFQRIHPAISCHCIELVIITNAVDAQFFHRLYGSLANGQAGDLVEVLVIQFFGVLLVVGSHNQKFLGR